MKKIKKFDLDFIHENGERMNKLRQEFDKVVNKYVATLLKMYEWDAYYGYWIADDTTGIYAYGDNHFIALHDLIYIVDNKVPEEKLDEWEEYCLWAHDHNHPVPNIHSWVKGCPRVSKEEIKRLDSAREDFEDAIENYKENV